MCLCPCVVCVCRAMHEHKTSTMISHNRARRIEPALDAEMDCRWVQMSAHCYSRAADTALVSRYTFYDHSRWLDDFGLINIHSKHIHAHTSSSRCETNQIDLSTVKFTANLFDKQRTHTHICSLWLVCLIVFHTHWQPFAYLFCTLANFIYDRKYSDKER